MPGTIDRELTRRDFVGAAGGIVAASAFHLPAAAGVAKPLDAAGVAGLEAALGRKVATPADRQDYDASRFIWNALFDRRPAIIASCQTAQDVAHCIRFARDHGLALSIRSGGHHPAGFAMTDGGLVIDMSDMNGIKIDKEARKVKVGPGVRVGALHAATEPLGLVVPTAANATIGMGGMVSGGGEGFFHEFGLSIDNLLSAEIVLADGRILRVDKTNDPDLFWAIRGGGGNFGVLTSMEFQAHPLPELMFGLMVYPLDVGKVVGLKWRDHVLAAAPDLFSACAFVRKPAPAMLMISKTGRPAVQAKAEFDALRSFGSALQEVVRPITLTELHLASNAGVEAGLRNFAYAFYLKALPAELLDVCMQAIKTAPSEDSAVFIQRLSDGIGKVPVGATAYPHRGLSFSLLTQARWSNKADDNKNIEWVKELWKAVLPFTTGEVYCNYISETNEDLAKRAYGRNYARLQKVKRRYDPGNRFNSTVAVKPA
jgi:FAD/FMN-containing dehydrogenase